MENLSILFSLVFFALVAYKISCHIKLDREMGKPVNFLPPEAFEYFLFYTKSVPENWQFLKKRCNLAWKIALILLGILAILALYSTNSKYL